MVGEDLIAPIPMLVTYSSSERSEVRVVTDASLISTLDLTLLKYYTNTIQQFKDQFVRKKCMYFLTE